MANNDTKQILLNDNFSLRSLLHGVIQSEVFRWK